jgi:hypothetical protein
VLAAPTTYRRLEKSQQPSSSFAFILGPQDLHCQDSTACSAHLGGRRPNFDGAQFTAAGDVLERQADEAPQRRPILEHAHLWAHRHARKSMKQGRAAAVLLGVSTTECDAMSERSRVALRELRPQTARPVGRPAAVQPESTFSNEQVCLSWQRLSPPKLINVGGQEGWTETHLE